MNQQKIDMFILANQKYFPPEKIMYIRDRLSMIDESKWILISAVEFKDPTLILVLSILFGYLGIDRFILGDIGMGILKLLTGGLCGILTIIDWFIIMNKTRELNFNNFMAVL